MHSDSEQKRGIAQCVNLTDELFLLALQLTTFPRLTSLTLEKCHQGTAEFDIDMICFRFKTKHPWFFVESCTAALQVSRSLVLPLHWQHLDIGAIKAKVALIVKKMRNNLET